MECLPLLGEGDTVAGLVMATELLRNTPKAQNDAKWKVQTEAATHKKNSIADDHVHFPEESRHNFAQAQ
jgi:hypothetical protein